MDEWKERQANWLAAWTAAGHVHAVDGDGTPDWWQDDQDFHGGPTCEKCGWGQCMCCTSPSGIKQCAGKEN